MSNITAGSPIEPGDMVISETDNVIFCFSDSMVSSTYSKSKSLSASCNLVSPEDTVNQVNRG